MQVRKLTIEDKAILEPFLTSSDLGWENDFSTLFTWDGKDTMRVIEEDGIVVFCNEYYGKTVFMRPFTLDRKRLERAIEMIKAYALAIGINEYRVRGLNEEQAAAFEAAGFDVTDDRGDYDYVYNTTDLKYLSGKAFHSKRNFVTRFEKSCSFSTKVYEDADRDDVMKLIDGWNDENSDKSSAHEYKAIMKALEYHNELGLKILLLKAGVSVIALSVTSRAANGVYHTLFEKADTTYDGVYQAINKYAALEFFEDGALVNRQEDLGVEGLRKAKLSYHPEILLKKHTAISK